MNKRRNEYIVVSRYTETGYDSIDWEEFGDSVRGFLNSGFELVGGVSVSQTGRCFTITQSLLYVANETGTFGLGLN